MKSFVKIFVLSALLQCSSLFAQTNDTLPVKTEKKDTLIRFDANRIITNNVISVYSDTTGNDVWIWHDKRSLGEILNEKAGYFINNFGGSSRSAVNYFGENRVGLYRDGIPLNDVYIDGFDLENISVNEIEKIEEISPSVSFLYGPYSSNGAINIITKDRFVPNMFSQLRYSQDRDGALYADMNFNFPVSRKFGIQLGLGNHGSDGHYNNSDFALWRGRIRLSYYPSDRLNFKLNFYQNKLQRGLNGGLVNSTKDTLVDPKLADVNNTDAYEKWTNNYTDLQTTLRLFNDQNSLTKIQLFTHNLLRSYRDEENRINPNGRFISGDYHYILYGLNVNQNLYVKFARDVVGDLNIGYSSTYNLANYDRYALFEGNQTSYVTSASFNTNLNSVYSRLDLKYSNFYLTGGVKGDFYPDEKYVGFGGQAEYNIILNEDLSIKFIAGGSYYKYQVIEICDYVFKSSKTNGINEFGFALKYDNLKIKFLVRDLFTDYDAALRNTLSDITFTSKYFDVLASLTTYGSYFDSDNRSFPHYFLKADISYHNFLFNNKLHLRTGFNLKYMSSFNTGFFDSRSNYFEPFRNNFGYEWTSKDNNFNVDFYIGARIGKANINLTFANLFNSLIYDTYIYPWDERGGFLKSLSRFTITWDFWN